MRQTYYTSQAFGGYGTASPSNVLQTPHLATENFLKEYADTIIPTSPFPRLFPHSPQLKADFHPDPESPTPLSAALSTPKPSPASSPGPPPTPPSSSPPSSATAAPSPTSPAPS